MAWVSYRPTPGKNTTRYKNTETGETRSRRQHEKETLNPTKYNQYYRRGVTKRKTEKFTKKSQTKHKVVSVTRWQDLQNLIGGAKPPKGKGVTAFVRITDHATGDQHQTQSVFVGGDWRFLLAGLAVNLAHKYHTHPDNDEPDEELSDDELDELAEKELEYELIFVSSL
jgi:hypothetical protein